MEHANTSLSPTTSDTTVSRTLSRLESLPTELFDKIISYVYAEQRLVVLGYRREKCIPIFPELVCTRRVFSIQADPQLAALLYVSKGIAEIASKALYQNTTFFFCNGGSTRKFLESVGQTNLANIRSVEVCFPSFPMCYQTNYTRHGPLCGPLRGLNHITRQRVHVMRWLYATECSYKSSLLVFHGLRHLKELSVELRHSYNERSKAYHWTSSTPFTGKAISEMLSAGFRAVTMQGERSRGETLRSKAILARGVALHGSLGRLECGDAWVRTTYRGEVPHRLTPAMEPQLFCRGYHGP